MTDLEWQQKVAQDDEDMFVKILGRRARIDTKPDDPERVAAIKQEWWVVFSLIRQGYSHQFDLHPWSHMLCRRAESNRRRRQVFMAPSRTPAKPVLTMPRPCFYLTGPTRI